MNVAVLVLLWFNATNTVLKWYKDAFQRKLLSPLSSLFSSPFRVLVTSHNIVLQLMDKWQYPDFTPL